MGLIASRTETEGPVYYHYDAHGNVVQRTSGGNTLAKDYYYDAFGVERNPDLADTNPFRYCGEQYDAETGNYYLRARCYTPGTGRFTQEDTHWNPGNMVYGDNAASVPAIGAICQSGNLFVYCRNNPVRFSDPLGLYDREAAMAYAQKYYNGKWAFGTGWLGRNTAYYDYKQDCANFGSQILHAGGIAMNDKWHSYSPKIWYYYPGAGIPDSSYDWDVSSAWRQAAEHYKYFSNPDNGFIVGDVIVIDSASEIPEVAKNGGIQPGDLMYFAGKGKDSPHHTTVISSVTDNDILYTAHTEGRYDRPLSKALGDEKVFIVRIRDDA